MRFGRATLLLLLPAAMAGAAASRALGAEADSLTTTAGETVNGRRLVLSGREVLIEAASGSVRRVPVAEVSAFSVTGKRKLRTATDDTIAVTGVRLAGGSVSFTSALGDLAMPIDRVRAIEFAGWKEHYAKLSGGFLDASGKAVAQQPLKISLALGYAATSGTSDTSNLSLSLDGSMVRGPYKLTFGARALVSEAEGAKTADQNEAAAKLDRYVNPRTYAYLRSAVFRDTITDVRLRLNAGAGLGRKLLMTGRHTLSGEAGLEYQRERRDLPTKENDVEEGGVWRGALKYAWKISPRADFSQEGELLGNLEGPSEVRSRTVTALSAKVAENVLMKFSFTWEYDDEPPAGNEHSEFRFESAIGISF